jgi:hypothetical protein
MVQSILRTDSKIVCVSSISPSSVAEARILCRRLRANIPDVQIVTGFWSLESNTAQQRLGQGCLSTLVSTLSEAVSQVRQLTNLPDAAKTSSEPQVPNLTV